MLVAMCRWYTRAPEGSQTMTMVGSNGKPFVPADVASTLVDLLSTHLSSVNCHDLSNLLWVNSQTGWGGRQLQQPLMLALCRKLRTGSARDC